MEKTNFTSTSYLDIKSDLKNLIKSYYYDNFNNFSDSSLGMMYVNLTASIGELLTYYINASFEESLLETSNNINNVYALSQSYGYKPVINSPASVVGQISLNIPKADFQTEYDAWLLLNKDEPLMTLDGNKLYFNSGEIDFLTEDLINFTQNTSTITETETEYVLTNTIPLYNLTIKTDTIDLPLTAIKYWSFDLEDTNLVKIKRIYLANYETTEPELANIFYEVKSLADNYIFLRDDFTGKLENKKISNKFISTILENNKIKVTFGTGTVEDIEYDESFINSTDSIYGNPSTFLYSKSYGTTPVQSGSLKLFVEYYVSDGSDSNIQSNTLTTVETIYGNSIIYTTNDFEDLLISNVSINNDNPSFGGSDGETITEIKNNVIKYITSQNGLINEDAYETKILSLPSKWGKISKAFVKKNDTKAYNVDIHLLSKSINGFSNVSDYTKENLKVYLDKYKILTDAINIIDTFIINIEVYFDVSIDKSLNKHSMILKCIDKIYEYFDENITINSPIYKNQIINVLSSINGVTNVNDVIITNIHIDSGDYEYSHVGYNIENATENNIVYPPKDIAIFEIKYKDINIKGTVSDV